LKNLERTYLRRHLLSIATELHAYPYSRWQGKHEAEEQVLDQATTLIQSETFVEECWSVCKFLDLDTKRYAAGAARRIAKVACIEAIIVEAHKAHATERRSIDEHLN